MYDEKDIIKLQTEKKTKLEENKKKTQVYEFVKERVLEYLEKRDQRLFEESGTIKNYIINAYSDLAETMSTQCNQMFPFHYYGLKSTNSTLKAYPQSFKQYFINVLRSFVKTNGGYKKVKQEKRKVIWMPSNSLNIHDKDEPLSKINEKTKNVKIEIFKIGFFVFESFFENF